MMRAIETGLGWWCFGLELVELRGYLTPVLLHGCRVMSQADNVTTIVSTKGQVILPKAIRQRREWEAGTRLVVEETEDGVLLRKAPAFAMTRPDQVFGVLAFKGEPKSLDDMDAGVLAEARRHHDSD